MNCYSAEVIRPKAENNISYILPYLAKPFTPEEKAKALQYAKSWQLEAIEDALPVSFIGTGANLNEATEVGLKRASEVLSMTVPEVLNRATITGSIQIGRHPGVVTVTFLAPNERLAKIGVLDLVKEQYNIL